MSAIWTIIGMAAVTFATRYLMILALGSLRLGPGTTRWMRLVPPSILSALVFPALVAPAGSLDLSLTNVYLLAGVVAGLIAFWRKNVLLTVTAGLACFLILNTQLK